MTALLDLEPGSIGPDTWRQELGARLAASVQAALPPVLLPLLDLGQAAAQLAAALAAATAGGSALAAIPAVGAAVAAIAGLGRVAATLIDDETRGAIVGGLDDQARELLQIADGRALAAYVTGPGAPTGAPPGEHRVYAGPTRSPSEVRGAWTPGAVAVVPRGVRYSCAWSLVPWASFRSLRRPASVARGIWGAETGPDLPAVEADPGGATTERQLVRRALEAGAWPEPWLSPPPIGDWQPGAQRWAITVIEASQRRASPPVLCRRVLAPGLAPWCGPRGEPVPVSADLLTYAAALGAAPPPDLDQVIEAVRIADAADAKIGGRPGLRERVRLLAWSREHLRRSAGQAPRAWDPWQGAPDDGPAAAGAAQAAALGEIAGATGGGGGGGGGLILGLGAAVGLSLLRRSRR